MKLNLDPIHWLAIALLICLAVLSVWHWGTVQRLEVCKSNHATFKAQAESNYAVAVLATEQALAILSGKVSNLNGELENAKTDLDRAYAEYNRLRRQPAATRPPTAAPLSDAARSVTCDQTGQGRLAGTLERIETGVLERLAKPRDEVILLLNTCLGYVQALPTAPPEK